MADHVLTSNYPTILCPPGTIHTINAQHCVMVPRGFFNPHVGSTSYIPCHSSLREGAASCGQFTSGGLKRTEIGTRHLRIPSGYYSPAGESYVHYLCPPGYYTSTAGAYICEPCDDVIMHSSLREDALSQELCSPLTRIIENSADHLSSSSLPVQSVSADESSLQKCAPFRMHYSAFGLLGAQNCFIQACQGSTLVASDCPVEIADLVGGSCAGDQYFQLYLNRKIVAANDDSCGYCSLINYTVTEPGCHTFALAQGCYGREGCSGHVIVSGGTVVFPAPDSRPETPQEQRQVLVDLFEATDGRSWTNNTNWNSSQAVWTWFGVEVDEAGNVVTLNLVDNNLRGQLPDSLVDLSFLQHLWLQANGLYGIIPEQIGFLSNLMTISLFKNDLVGPIPSSLSVLVHLVGLDFGMNRLTGPLPQDFGDLTALKVLLLNENDLSSSIPASFCNLTSAMIVFLNSNSFVGPLPGHMHLLSSLISLNISDNMISGEVTADLFEVDH